MNLAEGIQTVEWDHKDQTITMAEEFYRWLLEQAEDLAEVQTWWGSGPEADINELGRMLSGAADRGGGYLALKHGIERRTKALGLTLAYRLKDGPRTTCFIFSDASRVISVAWSQKEAAAFLAGEEEKNRP